MVLKNRNLSCVFLAAHKKRHSVGNFSKRTISNFQTIFSKDAQGISFFFGSGRISKILGKKTLKEKKIWAESDLNQRRRAPADLQSAPVDHFGIGPFFSIFVYFTEKQKKIQSFHLERFENNKNMFF